MAFSILFCVCYRPFEDLCLRAGRRRKGCMHISIGEENVGIECGVHTHTHTCTVAKRRDGRPTCVRAEFPGRCSAEKRRDGEAEQDGIGMAPCKTYGEAGCNADRLEATAQSLSLATVNGPP